MIDLSGVDVVDLVERLNLGGSRLTSGGHELNFNCFDAEHRDGGSAYINVDKAVWMCHGCHRRGTAVDLTMGALSIGRSEAERLLREWYGIEFSEPAGGSMAAETDARFREREPPPPRVLAPAAWLSSLRLDWSRGPHEPFQEYMLQRGFSAETLQEYDIGYDYLTDRITIPIFDIEGNLVGAKARDWTGERQPKYLIIGDTGDQTTRGFNPYEASEVVFGLHRNREHKKAALLEGELNAIALAQMGEVRPIASGMSYLSERQVQLIIREVDEVVLYYDHGQAGYEGVWGRMASDGSWLRGAAELLEPYISVKVAEPLEDDPASLLQQGRHDDALRPIHTARSSLTARTVFV